MTEVKHLDVRSEGRFHLLLALQIAESHHGGLRMNSSSHVIERNGGIFFGWHDSCKGVRACEENEKLTIDAVADMIFEFLKNADYGKSDDIDGSTHKGYRFVCGYSMMPDYAGKFYLNYGAFPEWIYYHK